LVILLHLLENIHHEEKGAERPCSKPLEASFKDAIIDFSAPLEYNHSTSFQSVWYMYTMKYYSAFENGMKF
jgi:hypothetical protein